jgi:hypothetical protein
MPEPRLERFSAIFFLPESVAKKVEGEKTAALSEIPRYLADPAVRPVLTQKFAYALGLFSWFAAFALVLQAQLGYGPTQTSYVFAGSGVISILLQLGVERMRVRSGICLATNGSGDIVLVPSGASRIYKTPLVCVRPRNTAKILKGIALDGQVDQLAVGVSDRFAPGLSPANAIA